MIGACSSSGNKRLEAQVAHAGNQQIAVCTVTPAPAGDAAFFNVLGQCLVEGQQHVGRWGKTPLPGFLHIAPLFVEIQHQRR